MTLADLMSRLPRVDGALVSLWAEGHSFRQIAALKGLTAKTAKHRIYRAIERPPANLA